MADLDPPSGAGQMEFAAAGKSVSPTSWSVLAVGIQVKIPCFPWRRYKKFLQMPLMAVISAFLFQYFCADISTIVQKTGYGVIRFVPYIVIFSIMGTASVIWWVMDSRGLQTSQRLERLPLHNQDIQMENPQQPDQDIPINETPQAEDLQMNETTQQDININETPQAEDLQMNETTQQAAHMQMGETPQAEDTQMDQTLQGVFVTREEIGSLIDIFLSARSGDMTRAEVLDKMTQLLINEPLEMREARSRHQSPGSRVDGTPQLTLSVFCPALESRIRAGSLSHSGVVLKIPQNVDVGGLAQNYDVNLPGCRELHRRIEIGPEDGYLREFLVSQILGLDLRTAWTLDKDSTIQLGSCAIFKYTDAGIKCWMLQEDWTPTILDVHRSTNFFDYLRGERANWTVIGFNLRHATLRVATTEKTENLNKLLHYKTKNGVDVVAFKEPWSFPMFMTGVYISASSKVELEDVNLQLHSEAIKLQRAYWISVLDAFMPRPRNVCFLASLMLASLIMVNALNYF